MTKQSSLTTSSSTRSRVQRNAFTLVELLVVIVIIGILVAILIPAVMRAISRAQEAAVATEIANLSAALDRFKNDNSVSFPDDFSLTPRDFDENVDTKKSQVDRMLGRLFRSRVASQDIPYNVNADNISQPQRVNFGDLDAAEAIPFWLLGFTDNGQFPLTGGAQNGQFPVLYLDPKSKLAAETGIILPTRNPVMELDQVRLGDRDKDGFPEYYPKFGGDAPYVYYASKNYQNLYLAALGLGSDNQARIPLFWLNRSNADQSQDQKKPRPAPLPYLGELPEQFIKNNNNVSDKLRAIAQQNTLKNFFAEPQKFQILAPGLDGQYVLTSDTEYELINSPKDHPQINQDIFLSFSYAAGPYSDKAQKDNITNFAGGTLESKMP